MASLVEILKSSIDKNGIENTLKITRPGQLYGTVFEEVTSKEIGSIAMAKLAKIANKTLDFQRPFLMIGDTAMFYSEFLNELSARNGK